MKKRTLSLVVGLATLMAFIAPAGAGAQPLVTNSLEEAPSELEAVSENMILLTPLGQLACTTVRLEVELGENTTETAFGQAVGLASGSPKLSTHEGPCEGLFFGPTDPMTMTLTELDLIPDGTGTARINTTFDITTPSGTVMCGYEGVAELKYVLGSDVLTLQASVGSVENSPPCVISSAIAADFTLTEFGEPVTIG